MDALDSQEAKQEARKSALFPSIKPEIDLAEDADPYSNEVYEKAGKTSGICAGTKSSFKMSNAPFISTD